MGVGVGVGVIGLVEEEEEEEEVVRVGEGGGDEEKMRARRWATVVLPEEEGPERATRKGGWWGLDISFPERRGSIAGWGFGDVICSLWVHVLQPFILVSLTFTDAPICGASLARVLCR